MEEKKKKIIHIIDAWFICILSIVLGIIITIIAINPQSLKAKNFDKGYKQGQIDALNGIQNYDKVATKDSIYIKIR